MSVRFEARYVNLPLQPREIQSSKPAPLSRERFSTRTILDAKEPFRTGSEGLFAAVRSELSQARQYVPQVNFLYDPNQPITVAIASSNNKKVDSILEEVTSHPVNVIRIPEAQEMHSKDAILDARSKAWDAARLIRESEDDTRRAVRIRPHVTMANDQMNAIPVITEDPVTHVPVITFERLGKPATDSPENPVESVKQMFETLSYLAERHEWQSIPYLIELATVIHNPSDPDHDAVNLQRSAVFLSREGIKQLATDRFDEYVTRVNEQVGKANGKESIADIAGGLELQVLDDMGIVEFISGTPREIETKGFPPSQRPEAKAHAYRLALGAADEWLIREYFADIRN